MRQRDRSTANYVAYHRGSDGYLKDCRDCGRTIYMHHDSDGYWRPYASWLEGDVEEGVFELHDCPVKKVSH